ncbi:MAG: hypothetical protein JKX76_05660, partial [Colwellia sp.]|nr:hypothetical protein [Colwellia sp.]
MTKVMNKNFINKSVVAILLLASSIVNSYAVAEERTSISSGQLSKNLTTDSRLVIAKENAATSIVDQDIGKATGKTRTEILKSTTNKISKITPLARSNSYNNYADFAIYGATTLLQGDDDSDGYYQTFSVSFDADIYSYTPSQFGEVYAL